MLAALLLILILYGTNGSFDVAIFSKATDTAIRNVVKDEARADEALEVVKQERKHLKATLKRASKITKQFRKTDESHKAGIPELEPFIAAMAAERTQAQKQALDALFALRNTMTAEEWNAAFRRKAD